MADFVFAQGNEIPSWQVVLYDADNNPINLSTAVSVSLYVRETNHGVFKVVAGACVIVSADDGEIRYDWTSQNAADLVQGNYEARFRITFPASQTLDVPNDAWLVLEVTEPTVPTIPADPEALHIVSDDIFGTCYLTPAEFLLRKAAFPVSSNAIPTDRTSLLSQLATASRWVDAITGKTFTPEEEYTEQHSWNALTRRIKVLNPPVLSVTSFKIFVAPDSFATFNVADVFINNGTNYLELVNLASYGVLTPALASLGLGEAIVEIVYKSISDIPSHVKLATGFLAATLMEKTFVNSSIPSGVSSIQIGGNTKISRFDPNKNNGVAVGDIPSIVNTLLMNEIEIGVY